MHAYDFWSPASKMGPTMFGAQRLANIASSDTHELPTTTQYISRLKAYKLRTPFCQLRSSGSYQITPNLLFQIGGSAKYTRSGWDDQEAGESPMVKSEIYFRRTFGKWCLWCRNTHRSGSFHFRAIFIFVDSEFFGSATKGFPLTRFIIN